MRGVRVWVLPLPQLPILWAGCRGPLPTCSGRGCAGVGGQHCPLGLHALWGLRAAGVVGGRRRGGWPATVVRGVWCRALSLPRPSDLWGGQQGFCNLCVPVAVGVGVGTQQWPHSVLPCEPSLRTVGVAEGRPRGGCLSPLPGACGVRRSPSPGCPPCRWAVGVLYPRAVGAGVRVWGPSTGPVACMPCGGLRAAGVVGGVWVQAPSLLWLPALWAGCQGPLATCCGRGRGCLRCVWCLCDACRGAWCCPLSVPLVPPFPVLCCGVVLVMCLPCPFPRALPSLGCWLPPVSFVVSSLFTLSSTLRWPALLPGMHLFPASALVFVSVFLLVCFLGPGSRALFFLSCWVM